MESSETKVLCVGLCCLDIVMFCKSYPLEDSDQRCISHLWQRGGNASNNCTVFAEFNFPCEILGTMSYDIGGRFMKEDFIKHNISVENCHFYEEYESPTSTVWINTQNGSRTIVHSNKNMPEVSIEDFKHLNLVHYSWVHFECRPYYEDIKAMVNHVRLWNERNEIPLKISIEVEKPRLQLIDVLELADIVFISKDFAQACGYTDMISAVNNLSLRLRVGGIIICAWGEKGACAKIKDGAVYSSQSYPPTSLQNTLGAGDTFVAATIMGMLKDYDLLTSVENGCRVAGAKCGIQGTRGLAQLFPLLCK